MPSKMSHDHDAGCSGGQDVESDSCMSVTQASDDSRVSVTQTSVQETQTRKTRKTGDSRLLDLPLDVFLAITDALSPGYRLLLGQTCRLLRQALEYRRQEDMRALLQPHAMADMGVIMCALARDRADYWLCECCIVLHRACLEDVPRDEPVVEEEGRVEEREEEDEDDGEDDEDEDEEGGNEEHEDEEAEEEEEEEEDDDDDEEDDEIPDLVPYSPQPEDEFELMRGILWEPELDELDEPPPLVERSLPQEPDESLELAPWSKTHRFSYSTAHRMRSFYSRQITEKLLRSADDVADFWARLTEWMRVPPITSTAISLAYLANQLRVTLTRPIHDLSMEQCLATLSPLYSRASACHERPVGLLFYGLQAFQVQLALKYARMMGEDAAEAEAAKDSDAKTKTARLGEAHRVFLRYMTQPMRLGWNAVPDDDPLDPGSNIHYLGGVYSPRIVRDPASGRLRYLVMAEYVASYGKNPDKYDSGFNRYSRYSQYGRDRRNNGSNSQAAAVKEKQEDIYICLHFRDRYQIVMQGHCVSNPFGLRERGIDYMPLVECFGALQKRYSLTKLHGMCTSCLIDFAVAFQPDHVMEVRTWHDLGEEPRAMLVRPPPMRQMHMGYLEEFWTLNHDVLAHEMGRIRETYDDESLRARVE